MRTISKGREPASLTEHRLKPHCDYDNYEPKDDLRASLVREQRGICCYCLSRIAPISGKMKIEHWQCQTKHKHLELTYSNILGACMGGDGQPKRLHHCDTLKADSELKWNPSEHSHHIEQKIQIEYDGTISSNDATFDRQLNDVLGLNLAVLKNNRKGVLAAILEWWKSEKARLKGPVPRERLQSIRSKRLGDSTNAMHPFDPVAIWWLDQRLKRTAP